jgi:hypothetical protein
VRLGGRTIACMGSFFGGSFGLLSSTLLALFFKAEGFLRQQLKRLENNDFG